jgi:hypothetical protein
MLLVHLMHGLFLTWTQKFHHITDYILQYLNVIQCLIQPNPLLPTNSCLLTWRTNFFACGGEYPSSLVSGLPTTAPPFTSPLTLSHPTVPHSSGYIIYTDDISNSSRPRLEHFPSDNSAASMYAPGSGGSFSLTPEQLYSMCIPPIVECRRK